MSIYMEMIPRGETLSTEQRQQGTTFKPNKDSYTQIWVRTSTPSGTLLYPSFVDLLKHEELAHYRVVMLGLTHCRRDILAVDIDVPWDIENWHMLEKQFELFKVPHPNYYIINFEEKENPKERYHWQFGWFLNKPFFLGGDSSQGRRFREILKLLKTFIGAFIPCCNDFVGGYAKNPFSQDSQSSKVFSEIPCDTSTLVSSISSVTSGFTKAQMIASARLKGEAPATPVVSDTVSRTRYSYQAACKAILSYMTQHGGAMMPRDDVDSVILHAQLDILPKSPYSDVQSEWERNTIARDAINFATKEFNPEIHRRPSKELQEITDIHVDAQRAKALLEALTFLRLKEEGLKQKNIAVQLGVSEGRVSQIKRRIKDENLTPSLIETTLRDYYVLHKVPESREVYQMTSWIAVAFEKEGWTL